MCLEVGRFFKKSSSTLAGWLPGVAVLLVIGVFNTVFYNRFMPLTEGWFTVYAKLMNNGAVPYRDFYLYLPPAYVWLMAKYTAIFGYTIIALRSLGIGIIMLFTFGLWVALRRHFRPWVAAIGTMSSVIYYQTGNAHIQYDFVQVMNVAVVWGLVCLQNWCDSCPGDRQGERKWLFAAGVLYAFAVLVKQSNGTIIFCFSGLAVAGAGLRRGWREAAKGLLVFGLGAAIPFGLTLIWLTAQGAWTAAVAQLWAGALAAKGTPQVILFAAWKSLLGDVLAQQLIFIGAALLAGGYWRMLVPVPHQREQAEPISAQRSLIVGLAMAAIGVSIIFWPLIYTDSSRQLAAAYFASQYPNYVIPMALSGFLVSVLTGFTGCLIRDDRMVSLLVPAIVMLGVIWGNGTSAGYSETGMYLGWSFWVCSLMEYGGWFRLVRWPVLVAVAAIALVWVEAKYARPYYWWGVVEADVRSGLVPAGHALQRGMWVAPETRRVYDKVLALLEGEVGPGERLLVYPHIPIFYSLSDAVPMARAVVYWFDFLPDEPARIEAKILARNPPRVVIYFDMPDAVRNTHERLFRQGRECGQREIERVLQEHLVSGVYHEKGHVVVSEGFVLRVLVRR